MSFWPTILKIVSSFLREDDFLLCLALMTFYVALRLPSLHHGLWFSLRKKKKKNLHIIHFFRKPKPRHSNFCFPELLALELELKIIFVREVPETETIYDYFVWDVQ